MSHFRGTPASEEPKGAEMACLALCRALPKDECEIQNFKKFVFSPDKSLPKVKMVHTQPALKPET